MFMFLVNMSAQKYSQFKSDFTIIEKVVGDTSKSTILIGNVYYNSETDETKYAIDFPKEGEWHFLDSTLFVSLQDTNYIVKGSSEINSQSIFKNVLNSTSNDFGLEEQGYLITQIDKKGDQVFIEWQPPAAAKEFLSSVVTKLKNEDLLAVIFYTADKEILNTTYFEDYKLINSVKVPSRIKSHFTTTTSEVYKVISLDNVEIY